MKRDRLDPVLGELEKLRIVIQATNRLSGLMDATVVAQRAAQVVQRALGIPLASVALREGPDLLVMRGTAGTLTEEFGRVRVPAGQGIGGKILVAKAPVSVADYERDPHITKDFVDLVVNKELVHGMAGVPLEYRGEMVGVLYAGIRHIGLLGDRALSLMLEMAPSLGALIGGAMVSEKAVRLSIEEERQSIALQLHDSVGQLLFGIGAAARRVQEKVPAEASDLLSELKMIEAQTSQAASYLRDALRAMAPSSRQDALSAVIHMDAEAFEGRSGVAVAGILLGEPFELRPELEAAILAVVREGLHNVEKHAAAGSVVLTLRYSSGEVEIVVQDDGRGLPADFAFDPLLRSGERWGLASLYQRVERLGGSLQLVQNEDGGVTLRATIPTES